MTPEMQYLCDSLSCTQYRGNQHTEILIQESDPSAKLKKLTLKAQQGDWFSFAPDKGRGRTAQMSPLLATGRKYDHHRACDVVVVVHRGNDLIVLYIDLKSGNPSRYEGQFKSTRQFVRYALGLLKEFQDIEFDQLEERYIVFFGGKKPFIDKRPTVPFNFLFSFATAALFSAALFLIVMQFWQTSTLQIISRIISVPHCEQRISISPSMAGGKNPS